MVCGLFVYLIIKKKIFLSRDNFGEKPLYYYFDGNNLIFGSEIKYLNEILSKKIPKKLIIIKFMTI